MVTYRITSLHARIVHYHFQLPPTEKPVTTEVKASTIKSRSQFDIPGCELGVVTEFMAARWNEQTTSSRQNLFTSNTHMKIGLVTN